MVRAWLKQRVEKSFAGRSGSRGAVWGRARLGVETLESRLAPASYTLTGGNLYLNTTSGSQLIDTNVRAYAQSTASGSQQVYDLTLGCQVKQYNGSGWTPVTGANTKATGLAAAGGNLFMLAANNGATNQIAYEYTGSGTNWTPLNGSAMNATALVSAGGQVYLLGTNSNHSTGTVWQYDGSPTSWTVVSGTNCTATELVGGGGNAYMLASTPNHPNTVWEYSGSGTAWTAITGTNTTATALVAADAQVYMLASNNGAANESVWEYNGSGTSWAQITGPTTYALQLVCASGSVYMVGYNIGYSTYVWQYTGSGASWTALTGTALPTALSTWFLAATEPVADTAYSPAGGTLFGPAGPVYQDVQQGNLADCWLEASLAETAARAPADIQNMFNFDGYALENGAQVGVYSVRLYTTTGLPMYFTVDTQLPSGGAYYDQPVGGPGAVNGSPTPVLWVALAEKAYAEANAAGFVTSNSMNVNSYDALNYGDSAWALQAVTGKPVTDYSINPTNIAAAWNAGQLVVLCTINNTSSSPGLVGNHCYALVGYDPSNSMGLPYELFNPWGVGANNMTPESSTIFGLFDISAAALTQYFSWDSFGNGAAAGGTSAQPPVSAPAAPKAIPAQSGGAATAAAPTTNLPDAFLNLPGLMHKRTAALDAFFADFGNA
jgi:hypothetical protein